MILLILQFTLDSLHMKCLKKHFNSNFNHFLNKMRK